MYIFANFSSSCSKYFNHWHATSVSTFPPSFRCSSTVSFPPENAYLFIFFFTVLGESVIRIAWEEFELEDLPLIPVSGDMNFACRIAGFLCPSFWTTSRDILKCGSWSTASGIRQYSSFPDRMFGRKIGTVCIEV